MQTTQEEKMRILRKATVRIVAREGLERTTTKRIAEESGIDETYIFRIFGNKDKLLKNTFLFLDSDLFAKIKKEVNALPDHTAGFRKAFYEGWKHVWEYLMKRPYEVLFFMRYYYSAQFLNFSIDDHLNCLDGLAKAISKRNGEDVDTDNMIYTIFNTTMSTAMQAILKKDAERAIMCDKTFNVIYRMVISYTDIEYESE